VIHFTDDRSLLTAENVQRLWDATMPDPERNCDPVKVQRAIDHSFAVQVSAKSPVGLPYRVSLWPRLRQREGSVPPRHSTPHPLGCSCTRGLR